MTRDEIIALAQADRAIVAILEEVVATRHKQLDPAYARDLAARYEAATKAITKLVKPGVLAELAERALAAPLQ